jgi:hypothetical protein
VASAMELPSRNPRRQGVRAALLLAVLTVLVLGVPASASAKGFTRVVLIGSNGRSVEVRAQVSVIDGLLSSRGSSERLRGGYLRLFFVGPVDFPADPARYYPDPECCALDWPTYETSCGRISATLVRLLRPARALPRFNVRPTVLRRIKFHGRLTPVIATAAALKDPVEMALDRTGRAAVKPRRCYVFSGRWRDPAAALRPRRFLLCPAGVYANGHLHPLRRGVWEWFRLNVN